ncbi:serine/threonine-protein kinase [Gemmatimonas aurantiaca]|uniref:serine/threonine-protein kinase n=1 Tax=Gemmatimonas aurantiaca TaxID=173480 RepID=UPI00301D83DA
MGDPTDPNTHEGVADRETLRRKLSALLEARYELHEELGGGGMSVVYRATERAFDRVVVIKVLAPELTAALDTRRFAREINIAARLQHPNIVPMLSAQIDHGIPYYVMPYVKGRSLRDRLGAGRVPFAESVSMLRDVARALACAHAEGVVHRDIKPENVLLAGRVAMVTDFGIAKALIAAASNEMQTTAHTLTQFGASVGTPRYIAPEQAVGIDVVDHRADLYSWGVMAYELLASVHMFADRSGPRQMVAAHIAEMPRALSEVAPDVPEVLADLVMRTLAKDPDQRPDSAEDLLTVLEGFDHAVSGDRFSSGPIKLSGTHAVPDTWRTRFVRPGTIAAVFVVLAAVAVGVIYTRPRHALDERLLVAAPFRVASADPALQYLREGMIDLLSANLTTSSLRVTPPRTVMEVFASTAGAHERDATETQALTAARRLGAGHLLLGDVVATSSTLTFTARLLDVAAGTSAEPVGVTGSVDSVPQLVDRLSLAILTRLAPDEARRLGNVNTTSVVALRSYLEGLALMRNGRHPDATVVFRRAIEADTTFALAGIGLRLAASWNGNQLMTALGTDVAWRHRARLSASDRALLTALIGSRYPEPTPTVERLREVRRYVALAPQRAEAWYLLGDALFHYGHLTDISEDSADTEASASFLHALDLDSTYLSAAVHLTELALWSDDRSTFDRVSRIRFAADSDRSWLWESNWYRAAVTNAPGGSVWLDSLKRQNWGYLTQTAMREGVGARAAFAVTDSLYRLAEGGSPDRFLSFAMTKLDWLLLLGRPQQAQQLMQTVQAHSDDNTKANMAVRLLRQAMMGEHDTTGVGAALRHLAADEALAPTDTIRRGYILRAVRMTEPWRLAQGDTSRTRLSLQRLHAATVGTPTAVDPDYLLSIGLIEAMYAQRTRRGDVKTRLAYVDSLLQHLDYSRVHEARTAFTSLQVARMWEQEGEPTRALVALRRSGDHWLGSVTPFWATRLRERGRLAARLGHREEARLAYARYLAYRFDVEPPVLAQVDTVTRALQALGKPGR